MAESPRSCFAFWFRFEYTLCGQRIQEEVDGMSLWQGVLETISSNMQAWLGLCLGLQGLWGVLFVGLALRWRSLNRRLHQLTAGATGASLERVLVDHLARVEEVDTRQRQLEQRVLALETRLPWCLQHVGLVRYDAFEDVGGQQSFAVALLDAQQNGVVLTSVFSRADVRVYAKALRQGQPSHPLSEEEQQAIQRAFASG
jgi:hypothetical protein